MKKLILVLALTLVACGPTEKPTPRAPEEETANLQGTQWEYIIVDTPQGPVPCLIYDNIADNAEAVSCDWSKR